MNPKKKILFICEAVTLAQVTRLKVLASRLDPSRYEVVFASAEFDPIVFSDAGFRKVSIGSISKQKLSNLVRSGRQIYDYKTLAGYVREEMNLLEKIEPDFVVGDLRWSLAISAPATGTKLISLINAYWDPGIDLRNVAVPDHPIIRVLGEQIVAKYFHKALPAAFDHFAAPVNKLRRQYGLPEIGSLRDVLTYGNKVLHPDTCEMFPGGNRAGNKHFIGPVLWAPPITLPEWWDDWRGQFPLVYVTPGSSGRIDTLPVIIEALSTLPVRVAVATANGKLPSIVDFKNVRMFDYLPGDIVARQAALVISNGGSSTGYQALNEGTPVLGLASNLDQFLASHFIEKSGAGLCMKARTLERSDLQSAVQNMMTDDSYRSNARQISRWFSACDAHASFEAALCSLS